MPFLFRWLTGNTKGQKGYQQQIDDPRGGAGNSKDGGANQAKGLVDTGENLAELKAETEKLQIIINSLSEDQEKLAREHHGTDPDDEAKLARLENEILAKDEMIQTYEYALAQLNEAHRIVMVTRGSNHAMEAMRTALAMLDAIPNADADNAEDLKERLKDRKEELKEAMEAMRTGHGIHRPDMRNVSKDTQSRLASILRRTDPHRKAQRVPKGESKKGYAAVSTTETDLPGAEVEVDNDVNDSLKQLESL